MAMMIGKRLNEPATIGRIALVAGRIGVPYSSRPNQRLAQVLIIPSATRTAKAGLLKTSFISNFVRAQSWAAAAEPERSGRGAAWAGAGIGTGWASAGSSFLRFFERPGSANR